MGVELSDGEGRRGLASLAEPFQLLGVDPSASGDVVREAYGRVQRLGIVDKSLLDQAVAGLLDPERRLQYELAYPLDATPDQVEATHMTLQGVQEKGHFLAFARQLPPLSCANFLAQCAAHQPLAGELIITWIDAHASIDPAEIFEMFRSVRHRAGLPVPSFMALRQGLDDLFKTHAQRVLDSYASPHSAAGPLVQCVRESSASGSASQIEAMGQLLDIYRGRVEILIGEADEDIALICRKLKDTPEQGETIERLREQLEVWASLSSPLLVPRRVRGATNLDNEKSLKDLGELLLALCRENRHLAAKVIVQTVLPVLSPIPELRSRFEDILALIGQMLLEPAIDDLRSTLARFKKDPQAVIKSINQTGFCEGSHQEARQLWNAFFSAANHSSRVFDDRPWTLIGSLAADLADRTDGAQAAISLMEGLIAHGERLNVTASLLDALRENLRRMRAASDNRAPEAPRRWPLFALLSIMVVAAFIFLLLANANLSQIVRNAVAPKPPDAPKLEPELLPPVGTGQRLTREYVRYCHFQEQRLRVIKQKVQGTDDVRAYNALVADYNARCSDFFYQDEDLEAVKEEVKNKQAILAEDAERIMSTWPWRRSVNPSK
jgi:hypothetical protein